MTTAEILTLIISILAFGLSIVSLVLSHRISFNKTVKEKQLETVYQLIGMLSKTDLNFMAQNENGHFMTGLGMYHLTYTNIKDSRPELFGRKHFFFQVDSGDSFEFLQILGNPFLPREIFEAMNLFYYSKLKLWTYEEVMATGDFVALITLKQKTDQRNYYQAHSEYHKSFENFTEVIRHLYKTVNTWLDKYEAGDLKFKLDNKF